MPIYNNTIYNAIIKALPKFVKRDIYDIPFIETQDIDTSKLNNETWLINMHNANPKDGNASKKIVHAFCYDNVLNRVYKNPYTFLHKVAPYYAVASFDFSMHQGMDFKQILCATYNNRWIGAFLQAHGKRAFATVGWVDEHYDDICFAGLRDGATFIISTLGANNTTCKHEFLRGYAQMRKRFPNSKIICVGNKIQGMDSDVAYVPYKDSFGNWEKYPGFWQQKFINADGTLFTGGDMQ